MSANIVNILNELSISLGREAVIEACKKFSSADSAKATKATKAKKDVDGEFKPKPRGPSTWNLEVRKVFEEMAGSKGIFMSKVDVTDEGAVKEAKNVFNKAAKEKGIDQKIAMQEAARRRHENNPEALAKYEKNRAKADAKRASKEVVDTVIPKKAARSKME